MILDRSLARTQRFGILGRLRMHWRARALRLKGEVHAAAKAYELLGQRRRGAKLLLAGGMPRLAAEMFEDAGYHQEAGDALIAAGRKAEALEAYKRAGSEQAVSDVARLGDFSQKSAEHLLSRGHLEEALHAHRRAGRRYHAADLLEQEARYEEAAAELEAAYAGGGDGRDYWHHLKKNGPLEQARPKLARRIAELHARTGAPAAAASYFEKSGDLEQASALFERSGDQRGLARCLLSGVPAKGELTPEHKQRVERAARALAVVSEPSAIDLFRRVGNFKEAASLSRAVGDMAQAATLFTLAKMSKEAATCARAAGDLEQAAALFEDAGDYVTASTLYEEIGHLADAAAAARRAKDPEREAKLYLKAGDPLRAAQAQIELGRGEAALKTLKQVPRTDPYYGDACVLAAKVHAKAGRHAEAIPLFVEGMEPEVHFAEDVPTLLTYVQSLEAEGLIERGLEALSRLDGKAFAPSDLAQRKQHLQSVARGKVSPAPSSSGVGPALSAGSVARSSGVQAKDLVGSVLAGYTLLRFAGEGSFAWVYEAQRSEEPRVAAIKVLKPMLLSASAPQRFLREGRSLALLKNPHVIRVYEMGELDGLCYLVLEFVKGPTLKKVISDDAPLPIPLACRYGAGILSALGCAHKNGVVHRDLKPANVLIDRRDSRAKVLDFGLALLFDDEGEDGEERRPGAYLGTPRYASPEQARGQEVGEAADQYAAALVLYEMIGGALPFTSRNSLGYLNLHATEPPKPLRELRKDVPKPLEEAILRALAKKPEDRFPSVGEFERVVAAHIGRRSTRASRARRT
ncbi:MAG: protein kinase [Planctomycetota bacterium]